MVVNAYFSCKDYRKPKMIFLFIIASLLIFSRQRVAAEDSTPQSITVYGTVRDAVGPIFGVGVEERGVKGNGTITDTDGKFTLTVKRGATLFISCIGYKSIKVKAVEGKPLDISLTEDSQMLNDVVVVGFGTQKKLNMTGAVGLASASEIESRPVVNATQALQGLVPGLQISVNNGELDKKMSINIRGNGTIGSGSSGSPLVLIDGMEGDINTVNPQDIESISVLKDAAASSIYGSRAPFGVILITTKTGEAGKTIINYNNSLRVSSPVSLPKMMDSYTFANYFNEASKNGSLTPSFTDAVMQQMLDFQASGGTNRGGLPTDGTTWGKPAGDPFTTAYANTDWFSEIYKSSSFSQDHNITISGGGKCTYYASLGYLDQNGLLRHGTDNLKRYNATVKFGTDLTDWLKFNYSLRYVRQDFGRPTYFSGGMYDRIGRQTWPNLPVYDENGYYFNNNAENPVMLLAQGGQRSVQTDKIYHQAALVFEPIKGWSTNVEFNYSTNSADTRETVLPCYNHDVSGKIIDTHGTTSLYQDYTKEDYMNWNIYSTYSQMFGDGHNVKLMGGFQSEEMLQKFFRAKGYGLQVEELPELDLISNIDGLGKDKAPEVGGYRNEWATVGFFARANYNYKERYLFEANLRYDGTSRFRQGHRWQLSPSFSVGWNIAEEEFWESLASRFSVLKLRFSYGELGNMNTTDWYPTYRTMILGQSNGQWLQNGLKPSTAYVGGLINTALTWEKVRTWNAGLDWSLFNNRLTGSADAYVRYTDNMVGPSEELPSTLGAATPKSNNCDLRTQGWELSIAWQDRTVFGMDYSAKFNISDARTYIDRYPGNPTNSINTYIAGREIGEIWGFETIGIAKTDAQMQEHLEKVGGQSALGSGVWTAGDIMYADLDGKPGITRGAQTLEDHGDLKVIGNSTPRYICGLDLNAHYSGFDVRLFFQGVLKRDYWQGSNFFWGAGQWGMWWSTGLKEHEDYFRAESIGLPGHEIPANTDSYYPRPRFDSTQNQYVQSRYLQDASYIRLKNFQLGYTLPTSFVNKLGVSSCRLFVSGENLWTWTKLSKIFDPETLDGGNNSGASPIKSGGNAYPLAKTWSLGLSVSF